MWLISDCVGPALRGGGHRAPRRLHLSCRDGCAGLPPPGAPGQRFQADEQRENCQAMSPQPPAWPPSDCIGPAQAPLPASPSASLPACFYNTHFTQCCSRKTRGLRERGPRRPHTEQASTAPGGGSLCTGLRRLCLCLTVTGLKHGVYLTVRSMVFISYTFLAHSVAILLTSNPSAYLRVAPHGPASR